MTHQQYSELNLYVPDHKDYEYIRNFYSERPFPEIRDLPYNYGHFVAACLTFQIKTGTCWWEFDSFCREFARDQLLFDFGYEPYGYIYSPIHYELGIEHLVSGSEPDEDEGED